MGLVRMGTGGTSNRRRETKPRRYVSMTEKSLRKLRDMGYLATVVEKWNVHARVRQDLFGIIDILAIGDDETLGVQATSSSNHASRVTKLLNHKATNNWLLAGNDLQVWSWKKNEDRRTWTLRRTCFELHDSDIITTELSST